MSSPGGQYAFPGEYRGNRKGRKGGIPIKYTLLKSRKVELHRGKQERKAPPVGKEQEKTGKKGEIPRFSGKRTGADSFSGKRQQREE